MKGLLIALCFVFPPLSAGGQISMPGAFETRHVCAELTCLWTSDSGAHAQMGPYEAFLQAAAPTQLGDENARTSLLIRRDSKPVAAVFLKDLSASVRLTWSSDYEAFAVSWTDGGSIGLFHTRVFQDRGGRFVELPAVTRAFRHFKAQHSCPARGDNVQAWNFENQHSELMLVLSVYPTSDCGVETGHSEGYLVRISDGVVLRCLNRAKLDAYLRQHPDGKESDAALIN